MYQDSKTVKQRDSVALLVCNIQIVSVIQRKFYSVWVANDVTVFCVTVLLTEL